jgi:phosphoribosylformylglycinamidine cyclo-ligase
MGSNGLTSARHDVFYHNLANTYPESFDPDIPEDLIYSGQKKLTDPTDIKYIDVGKLVLSPTRTYLPIMKKVLKQFRNQIHGIIHCSGGAQTKVLNFIDKLHITKDNMFPTPPLFKLIQGQSGTDWKEMYQVFNMGHRLEVYLPEAFANDLMEISKSFGVDAKIIGRCETSEKKMLTIASEHGIFEY